MKQDGETYLKEYKIYVSGYETGDFKIEWMRYEKDCSLPEIVKTVPHVVFEVDDAYETIKEKNFDPVGWFIARVVPRL